jgi:hypothetical protein
VLWSADQLVVLVAMMSVRLRMSGLMNVSVDVVVEVFGVCVDALTVYGVVVHTVMNRVHQMLRLWLPYRSIREVRRMRRRPNSERAARQVSVESRSRTERGLRRL